MGTDHSYSFRRAAAAISSSRDYSRNFVLYKKKEEESGPAVHSTIRIETAGTATATTTS